MAGRVLTDERIKARKLYVEDGITSFTDLSVFVNATRQTIARWAEEDNWEAQRTSHITRPDNIAARMLRVLENYLVQVEEKQAAGEGLDPSVLKQLRDMTKAVKQTKDDFDERGGVITMWNKLISYLSQVPGERETLKSLKRIAPGFFSYIEK